MCGGRGTRLSGTRPDTEKPLVSVCGAPMVDRVCGALSASRVETVYAAVSPHTPDTRTHLRDRDVSILDAPGEGYVADLEYALERVETPVLTVASDLPLLASAPVDRVIDAADGSLAVYVPAEVKRRLGASVDATFEVDGRELAPTGLNVVHETDDAMYVSYDVRLAVNVNRPTDVSLAEALCE